MNFRTLDLNLLRVFDAVMADRNLTRAAQRLSITQPAVSNALKRLREAVGEELLTRTAYGVKPTPRGEALWPDVRAALGRLQEVLDPGEYDPQLTPVSFRLAMADATAALLMPALIAKIEAAQALANLHVIPLSTRDPRALVERGDADYAVGYFAEAVAAIVAEGARARLHHQRLYDTEYVCVMRRGHPLADRELDLDTYCAAHHLLVSFTGRPHGPIDETLFAMNRSRRIVLTVNQFFTAGRVVSQSDLIAVLPASFLVATGYEDELVQKPLPFAILGLHVELLWHMRHDRVSAHRWLRGLLIAAAHETHDAESTS
jgi:DNA-binding transcriptional LysR family regulator